MNAPLNLVGILEDGRLMAGPPESIRVNCKNVLKIEKGSEKKAAICKKIVAKIGGSIDECEHILPAGNFKIAK